MSTYGKKALEKWDYLERDGGRFNHSNMNVQLAILEKWYPIGMEVHIWNKFRKDWNMYDVYVIQNHKKHLGYYMIEVLTTNNNVTSVLMGLHQSNIRPTENWMKLHNRESRLNDILGISDKN